MKQYTKIVAMHVKIIDPITTPLTPPADRASEGPSFLIDARTETLTGRPVGVMLMARDSIGRAEDVIVGTNDGWLVG